MKKMTQDEVLAALKQLAPYIEELLYLPCCHTSGMHDPVHFEERKYVCDHQESAALERFCQLLGINPVTRCGENCGWCRDYPKKQIGAGLALFWPNEDLVKRFDKEASGWQLAPTEEIAEQILSVLNRKPQYKNIAKDFKREWKRFLDSEKAQKTNLIGRKEAFGRTSENSHVTAPLSKYRMRITGKKSTGYQPYELDRLVVHALRHSKRIFGL